MISFVALSFFLVFVVIWSAVRFPYGIYSPKNLPLGNYFGWAGMSLAMLTILAMLTTLKIKGILHLHDCLRAGIV